jgi:hypothetical protein
VEQIIPATAADIWSESDIGLIKDCLTAAVDGTFFPDWEFGTLFGFDRIEVKAILQCWPHGFPQDDDVRRAAIGALNNLLGYPHGRADELHSFTGASVSDLRDVLDRLVAGATTETPQSTAAHSAQE